MLYCSMNVVLSYTKNMDDRKSGRDWTKEWTLNACYNLSSWWRQQNVTEYSLGHSIQVHGRLNKISYLNVFSGQVHPVMLMVYLNGNVKLEQEMNPAILLVLIEEPQGEFSYVAYHYPHISMPMTI